MDPASQHAPAKTTRKSRTVTSTHPFQRRLDEFSIGVDLGGTNLRIAAFDSEFEPLGNIALPTRARDGHKVVLQGMCKAIRQLIGQFADEHSLTGIGIGSAGPLHLPSGRLQRPANLQGWHDVELKAVIENLLEMPVILESDANVAALGECYLGAGKEHRTTSLGMIALGTGVGSGLILNGVAWHGFSGMAGEAGHDPVYPHGAECGCGSRGCLEQYASATAVMRMAREAAETGGATGIRHLLASNSKATARDIAFLARSGDRGAKQIFDTVGFALGFTLASQINTLNLPLYVIGGGVCASWDLFAPRMFQTLRELCHVYRLTEPADVLVYEEARTNVLPALLGQDAGMLGAAMLPYLHRRPDAE
jgi:glucokinase